MNRLMLLFLILIIFSAVYWIFTEVFKSDIVITVLFFSLIALASIYYKAMIES